MDDRNTTISAALERLFRTYPQSDRGDALGVALERMERAKVYFEAVEQYEVRDIEAAVSSFLSGSAPGVNLNFIPPAPVVAGEVRRQLNLRLEHEARVKRPSLPPPDIEHSPESRARVGAMVQGFINDMADHMRTDDAAETKRKAERWGKVNARFTPDQDAASLRRRLFGVGDEDGDRDVA